MNKKDLGLTFDKNLLFEKHINEKIKTAQKGVTFNKHFSQYLPIKTREQMYKTLV